MATSRKGMRTQRCPTRDLERLLVLSSLPLRRSHLIPSLILVQKMQRVNLSRLVKTEIIANLRVTKDVATVDIPTTGSEMDATSQEDATVGEGVTTIKDIAVSL